MDVTKYRKGDPFDFPETLDELELMIGWFFDRIRVIVTVENLHEKFDGVQQVLDILHAARYKDCKVTNAKDIDVGFIYLDGQWFLNHAGSPNDILRLPVLAKRFSKEYRHNARHYETGENATPLINGDHLDTVENYKERSNL